MIEDRNLTDHFSFHELTKTSHSEFQDRNRDLTIDQIKKLTEVARLLEHVRYVLGTPLIITSGYRCPELNRLIGSTDSSQHLLCEAADFIPQSLELGNAFRILWRDIKDKGTNVGQLIHETAQRGDNVVSWIHISLGFPYRDSDFCKQILRMNDGEYVRLA